MGFKPRKNANKHKVQAGDTLEKIASKSKVSWKTLAKYNWGTDDDALVSRALFEIVGCETWPKDPKTHAFTGSESNNGTGEVLIPEYWKKTFNLDQIHKLKLKKVLPSPVVTVTKLDPWFIPELENCEIGYKLAGSKICADKLEMNVFGSNYCECTDWAKGLGKYKKLDDNPPLFNILEEKKIDPGQSYDVEVDEKKGWNGKVTTQEGLLGVKTGGKDRFVNVAFSPYTINFRYYKDDTHKDARLTIDSFWPQWKWQKTEPAVSTADAGANLDLTWKNDAAADRGIVQIKDRNDQLVYLKALAKDKLTKGDQTFGWDKQYRDRVLNSKYKKEYIDDSAETSPLNAPYTFKITTLVSAPEEKSLKIKWQIKDATDLEHGLIEISDKAGKVVHRKALAKGKLGEGSHEEAWDGRYSQGVKNSDGEEKITPKEMPYRIQIQARSGSGNDKGLALTAMHTEVRLYTHPETRTPRDLAYERGTDKAGLGIGLGPLVPGAAPAEGDGRKWFQYKLAESGFHPGRVDGEDRDDYKAAMREFQRSVPKEKTGAKFERLSVTGAGDEDTKKALKSMTDAYRRPWFGDPNDNKKDLDHKTEAGKSKINAILGDISKELMLWVDARHYYTQSGNPLNRPLINNTIGDYHGDMQVGDKLVEDYDAKIVPRPWIPLQVSLTLLSRKESLESTVEFDKLSDNRKAAMRKAIGPLRVSWTFDEVGPDLSQIDTSQYDVNRVRTLEYVGWALDQFKGSHERRDTGRKTFYMNCAGGADPANISANDNMGGIRPNNPVNYYKACFGFDDGTADLSLQPWRAAAVGTTESMATVVHDHLTAAQKDEGTHLYEPLIGVAGIYFRPSQIAGDGYRVSAGVQFRKFVDYEFPNLEMLDARYPTPPQASSSKLRVWRKSSVRGYLRWTTTNNAAHIARMNQYYHAGHVHFVDELGQVDGTGNPNVPAYRPSTLVNTGDATDYNAYKTIISDRVQYHKDKTKMKLDNDHCFPWYDRGNLGCTWATDPDEPVAKVKDLMELFEYYTWNKSQEGILLDMIRRAEEKDGRLRGHMLAHFVDTDRVYTEQYVCKSCNKKFWYLEKNSAGGNSVNARCSCGGRMRRTGKCDGVYRCANNHGPFNGPNDTFPGGGKYNGRTCPTCNDPSLDCKSVNITEARVAPQPAPKSTIVTYGIGDAGGGTWLCNTFDAWEWTHEVGHHRHLEHAAEAPVGDRHAEKDRLHDSQRNTGVNWSAAGVPDALNRRWDRCCIMSYVDSSTGYDDPSGGGVDHTYFCGKCVLRNRGWKVEQVGKGPGLASNLPEIEVAPASHDYGDVGIGKQSDHTFVVSNPGTARLEVSSAKISGTDITINSGGGAFNLNVGDTRDIVIRFAPTAEKDRKGELVISSNVDASAFPGRNPLRVDLKGKGKKLPDIAMNPAAKNYGNVTVGNHADQVFAISNPGSAVLNVTAVNITGGDFAIQTGGGAFNLNPGASRNITVRFTPATAGAKAGTLSLQSNVAAKSPLTANLNGSGTAAP